MYPGVLCVIYWCNHHLEKKFFSSINFLLNRYNMQQLRQTYIRTGYAECGAQTIVNHIYSRLSPYTPTYQHIPHHVSRDTSRPIRLIHYVAERFIHIVIDVERFEKSSGGRFIYEVPNGLTGDQVKIIRPRLPGQDHAKINRIRPVLRLRLRK